uniref:Uncharacterized LOC105917408 n=1 Tax=Fundulus heteroclitus TaxID=8078 RepID=A0A3Q2QWJ0_FUNHE
MAEGSSVSGSEGLEEQLQSLLSRFSGDESGADSELFCADFCKAVEEHASHWSVPLPQLRILQIALHHFSQASAFLPTSCDSVQRTISSLALSVFELLLFFDQKDQQALEHFTATFQVRLLAKYENVFLLHVERLLRGGGPWANAALQAILSESSLPQDEVDGYISSEPPVFLDLRVRYLTSCGRHSEAATLAKRCARHPAAGQLLFFLQVYLSWLLRTARHDLLHDEVTARLFVADVGGKEALHLICSLEREVGDEELLVLSTAVLSQQLQRGDLHHLCDLVLVWTSLHRRVNTSKRALLEACRQLMLSATNVKSIFPFIRVGEDGVQFCVELCANALRSCLPCDVLTKTLIYKTVAGLLPSDLDVCRVCALLVFFLERSVESYKTVYLLYMHPDQEYHVDDSPIGNNVRFETLQVLKKDLYFDPEFWNLMALRTSCLELMSEKVVSAALEEIMEDKWISKYCTRSSGLRSVCQRGMKVTIASPASVLDKVSPTRDHHCSFCSKLFTGARVVEHAMFHFRRDECTFCRTAFKDDLLAMMHLSDHIEKMKRLRAEEAAAVATATPRAKAANERPRRSAEAPQSSADAAEPRALRSEKEKCEALKKDLERERVRQRLRASQDDKRLKPDDVTTGKTTEESLTSPEDGRKKRESSQLKRAEPERAKAEPQRRVSCPVKSCSWAADLLKNRVSLLYHVLDNHGGDATPLELAFRVGNGKCGICMRVMWSFEHFRHHVERHRLAPRHPCPHRGCGARFKSGNEMRRHARKHSPLQAACCRPGCPRLFICLWALNLHEKEHYGKSAEPEAVRAPEGKRTQSSEGAARLRERERNAAPSKTNRDDAREEKADVQPEKRRLSQKAKEKEAGSNESAKIPPKSTVEAKDPDRPSKAAGAEGILKGLKKLIKSTLDEKGKRKEADGAASEAPSADRTADGTGWTKDVRTPCKKTLAAYGKKPYLRLPPTAYLDEKYTAMPKRRKEAPPCPSSRDVPESARLEAALQRHRCAKCFSTFRSAEELQSHGQQQKCSNLFGFDSDDEGECSAAERRRGADALPRINL